MRRSRVKELPGPDDIKFQVKYQYERSIGKYGRTPPSFSKAILEKCVESDMESLLTRCEISPDNDGPHY